MAARMREFPTSAASDGSQSVHLSPKDFKETTHMATSSILGGEHAPTAPKGTDADALGPSDSSDSGSDAAGDDRAVIDGGEEPATNADILPDRVGVFPDAATEVADAVDDPEALTPEELADENDGEDDDEETA